MSDRDAALAAWTSHAEALRWDTPWQATYLDDRQQGRWFPAGTLNVAVNCIDRHLPDRADRIAVYWEGEPGDRRAITYRELHTDVSAFAEALRGLSVGAGDRVVLYTGWVPEAVVAMLACARIGAIHELLPSALPAEALTDRLGDLKPKVLITQDGAWRHGLILPLKARVDEALAAVASVEQTIVIRRTGVDIAWYEGDHWYHDLLSEGAKQTPQQPHSFSSDHPLFAIHLASRRGRPSAIVHGTGGFLTYAAAIHRDALTTGPDDVFWCGVYGPLACGSSAVMYEGTLDTPSHARAWEIIARYGVNAMFTSPSVVRNLRRWIDSPPPRESLESLRLIVTGGEPIETETRRWLEERVGGTRALVADAWGQTELGGVVTITPPPDKGHPLPDPGLDVVDSAGRSLPPGPIGELVLRNPWPGAFVRIESEVGSGGDEYWSQYPGAFATGDRARREAKNQLVVLGRNEPITKISGQLVSLTQVAQMLVEHPLVHDADAIDEPDQRSGNSVVACLVLEAGIFGTPELARDIRTFVHDTLGGLATPRKILFVESFPAELGPETRRAALRVVSTMTLGEMANVSTKHVLAAAALRSD